MSFDAAYEALTDHDDDARWAYGTGFTDPLAGVDTAVPRGVDRADLTAYCLALGDDALIMSHRLQQWVTRAPELEDELALANIALDLLGQARLLLSRAGEVEGAGRDEDALAYLREAADFRNVRLAERADADFAHLVARLLVFATWRLALLDRLSASADPVLAAIGAKGVKEVTYHRDYAAQWVVRLGDGTELSHARMQAAIDAVAPLIDELFQPHPIESRLTASPSALSAASAGSAGAAPASVPGSVAAGSAGAELANAPGAASAGSAGAELANAPGSADAAPVSAPSAAPVSAAGAVVSGSGETVGAVAVDPSTLRSEFDAVWSQVLAAATLRPAEPEQTDADRAGIAGAPLGGRGRDGVHTAALAGILTELQSVARSLPGGVW